MIFCLRVCLYVRFSIPTSTVRVFRIFFHWCQFCYNSTNSYFTSKLLQVIADIMKTISSVEISKCGSRPLSIWMCFEESVE